VAPIVGSTLPRIWTPPLIRRRARPVRLRMRTHARDSYGFDVDDFARDVLDNPTRPLAALARHPRRRATARRTAPLPVRARLIVARQQGKSLLMRVLILYWMFVEQQPMTLAGHLDGPQLREESVERHLRGGQRQPRPGRRTTPTAPGPPGRRGEFRNIRGAKYRFAATNRRAGRSLSIDRLVLDEIREHANFDAWGASTNAMNARPAAQCIAVSNQGDDTSVVLDDLRNGAQHFIDTGEGDPRRGLFEWSAPPGSDPLDLRALALANPSLGRRTDADSLLGAARSAVKAGGEQLTSHLTEVMCIRVDKLDPAYSYADWQACGTDTPIDLASTGDAVALCVDVSLDGSHATLAAAALVDGLIRVEIVEAWDGHGCTRQLREQLPAIVARVQPYMIGWFPNGPAAAHPLRARQPQRRPHVAAAAGQDRGDPPRPDRDLHGARRGHRLPPGAAPARRAARRPHPRRGQDCRAWTGGC
jgi:hypothetical protein